VVDYSRTVVFVVGIVAGAAQFALLWDICLSSFLSFGIQYCRYTVHNHHPSPLPAFNVCVCVVVCGVVCASWCVRVMRMHTSNDSGEPSICITTHEQSTTVADECVSTFYSREYKVNCIFYKLEVPVTIATKAKLQNQGSRCSAYWSRCREGCILSEWAFVGVSRVGWRLVIFMKNEHDITNTGLKSS
jgi:hypothetical protein